MFRMLVHVEKSEDSGALEHTPGQRQWSFQLFSFLRLAYICFRVVGFLLLALNPTFFNFVRTVHQELLCNPF